MDEITKYYQERERKPESFIKVYNVTDKVDEAISEEIDKLLKALEVEPQQIETIKYSGDRITVWKDTREQVQDITLAFQMSPEISVMLGTEFNKFHQEKMDPKWFFFKYPGAEPDLKGYRDDGYLKGKSHVLYKIEPAENK